MLRAHDLLAAITSGKLHMVWPCDSPPDGDKWYAEQDERIAAFAHGIVKSEKFDFSEVFQTFDESLCVTTLEYAENGLIAAPYDICYFEFGFIEDHILASALLVSSRENDGFLCYPFVCIDGRWETYPLAIAPQLFEDRDGEAQVKALPFTTHVRSFGNGWVKEIVCEIGKAVAQAIVSLKAEGIESERSEAPFRLNSARAKKGKPPLFSHNIVRIGRNVRLWGADKPQDGGRSSPRLHWRRGHLREIFDGRKVKVRPCLVGDHHLGAITHTYVAHNKSGVAP